MRILKRTKIVATLGPATDDLEVLEKLFWAGIDVVPIRPSSSNKRLPSTTSLAKGS
jgi:pyruvate kinase